MSGFAKERRIGKCVAGIGGVSVLMMTDERVLFPVQNDPGTVSHPRGATDAARRHAVTRIRFYYRTISAPALQETGLLSHRLFLSFRKKAARIYRNRFKNASVCRPRSAKGFSFFRLLSFGMKKRATDGRPYGCGVFTGKRVESRTMLRATDGRPYKS